LALRSHFVDVRLAFAKAPAGRCQSAASAAACTARCHGRRCGRRIPPQFATLKPKPRAGDRWIHEIKFDGYRAQVHINKGRVRIFTRKGLDWTKKFSVIAEAFARIPVERAIIDGEIVVVEDEHLDGFDLRKSPQIERKRILKQMFDETGLAAPVLYSEHLETDGAEMFEAARKMNLEGIVS
jgi:bifunctional non-homologous end joining protein LigD